MKILIIGHGRHGKDTAAEFIEGHFGLTFASSSQTACDIFIFDRFKFEYDNYVPTLWDKFRKWINLPDRVPNYQTSEECFNDRSNHRKKWHDLITDYNKDDKARLARQILETNDMYVGMRSNAEVEECLKQNLFDWVIAVYDPRKPLESQDSFNINIWEKADFIVPNGGSLEEFEEKLIKIFKM